MAGFAQSTTLLVTLACPFAAVAAQEAKAPANATAKTQQQRAVLTRPALAILVSTKNKINSLRLNELRAYFKLQRKYWEGTRKPIKLLLPRYGTTAMDILLEHVYRKTEKQLRSYMATKQFGGSVNRPKFQAFVPNAKQAIKQIRKNPRAITVVLASDLPKDRKGIRVVSIEQKLPEDEGYSLVGKRRTRERTAAAEKSESPSQ